MPPRTNPIALPQPTLRARHFRPKAISWVLAGGVLAGVIGPQLVIFTKDLWPPYLFAATFVAQSIIAALAGLVLTLLQMPPPIRPGRAGAGTTAARRSCASRASSSPLPAAS